MANNVFMEHLKGIVETSYAGGDRPRFDWQTSIDMYNRKHNITEGMDNAEVGRQRSEFLEYVAKRQFDKFGNDVTKPRGAGYAPEYNEYDVNGEKVTIIGDVIEDLPCGDEDCAACGDDGDAE